MPKPHMVRISDETYQLLAEFAKERRRSVASMLDIIIVATLGEDTPMIDELERLTG